jgi:hypothetical protein
MVARREVHAVMLAGAMFTSGRAVVTTGMADAEDPEDAQDAAPGTGPADEGSAPEDAGDGQDGRHHLLHHHHHGEDHEGILDRLRHSGAGTTDPNIVGDAGPFDQPPGADPESAEGLGPAGLPILPPDEADTAQV